MKPLETIERFDAFLLEQGHLLDCVVVGGAALGLLGVVSRQTKDCDILHPELPGEILEAARSFAGHQRKAGEFLDEDWLNNGPASLVDVLPSGWEERLQPVFAGRAITLHSLGRLDLLRSKLFALCDRGIDRPDCLALKPTRLELEEIVPWLEQQDANPDWPAHTRAVLADLARELRHGV